MGSSERALQRADSVQGLCQRRGPQGPGGAQLWVERALCCLDGATVSEPPCLGQTNGSGPSPDAEPQRNLMGVE